MYIHPSGRMYSETSLTSYTLYAKAEEARSAAHRLYLPSLANRSPNGEKAVRIGVWQACLAYPSLCRLAQVRTSQAGATGRACAPAPT